MAGAQSHLQGEGGSREDKGSQNCSLQYDMRQYNRTRSVQYFIPCDGGDQGLSRSFFKSPFGQRSRKLHHF